MLLPPFPFLLRFLPRSSGGGWSIAPVGVASGGGGLGIAPTPKALFIFYDSANAPWSLRPLLLSVFLLLFRLGLAK